MVFPAGRVLPRPGGPEPKRESASVTVDRSAHAGLTEAEARARLAQDGPNLLPSEEKRRVLAIVWAVAREPMFLMLVAAGVLYLMLGEPGDALLLLGFVFAVMGITVVQERRTERALEALRDLASPTALVIRAGVRSRVAARELVRGDLVVIAEGDRVPADALLRQGDNISTDESLLTGESVPVRKVPSPLAEGLDRPGGDDLPSLFSGTLVTAGTGLAEIVATGPRSEIGRIGKSLQQVQPEATLLQKETGRLVRVFALVGLVACAAVVVVYGLTRGGGADVWTTGFLAGIAMAMATLPEEFPVVLTVFLALGAWRISRSRVLTRRMPAVETLGAATVLCVDKTGTLTQNRMTVREVRVEGVSVDVPGAAGALPESARSLLEMAILASRPEPFDPMEKALHAAGAASQDGSVERGQRVLVREYPLSPRLLAVTQAWRAPGGATMLATKGAPEAVADLCRLSPSDRAEVALAVAGMASRGLRVLGVARGHVTGEVLPAYQRDLPLDFVGLVGLEDPLRPTVPAAVAECRTAGVRVVMITGDYPATAQSIARQAGIPGCDTVLTGPELEAIPDAALGERLKSVSVFARVVPEQKLRIVQALKANGEIVAMTGDGVNDAPALKAAHIGIAMGGRGTDVAREAASLVLLDDDFSSIVKAIRLGRRIFDNIKKAIGFILAVHVPIAGLSMLPVFMGDWPLLLLPIHIVFLELIIDPSCSLIFEAEEAEPDVMRRPPRPAGERLFSRRTLGLSLLQGLSVLAACLAVFAVARQGHSVEAARALTFGTLVAAFLVIILVNRSLTRTALAMVQRPNSALRWVMAGATTFLALVLLLPGAQKLFHFAPLHPGDLALSIAVGSLCVLWFDAVKLARRPAESPS